MASHAKKLRPAVSPATTSETTVAVTTKRRRSHNVAFFARGKCWSDIGRDLIDAAASTQVSPKTQRVCQCIIAMDASRGHSRVTGRRRVAGRSCESPTDSSREEERCWERSLKGVAQIVVRSNHACALTASADVYCWALNAHGEIGDGTTTDRSEPTRIDLWPSQAKCVRSPTSAKTVTGR